MPNLNPTTPIFWLLSSLIIFADTEAESFFKFASESRSRVSICEACFEMESRNPNKVQPKIVSSITSFLIESNPHKAVVKIKEAIAIHDATYSKKEAYSKRKSKLNVLLSMYEKTLLEMEADLKETPTLEEIEQWKLGSLQSYNDEVDTMMTSGQHAPLFKDSFLKDIVLDFKGM